MIQCGIVSDKAIVVSAFFSPSRLLQQKTMITVENDIVAGDVLLCLSGNFYDSFGSIRNGGHLFDLFCFFFVKRASELPPYHPGRK